MVVITEIEFARICSDLRADSEIIVKHNPIGTREEILLWMLLGVLISYLSLSEQETPCFTGTANAATYQNAILFVLSGRTDFDPARYLDELTAE